MVSRVRGLVALTAAIAFVAAFALPASASAADTYANADSGSDSNDCLTPSTPCLTVTAALSKSGTGDTTFLDGIIFGESVTLDQGKSLASVPAPVNGPPIVSAVGGVGSGVGITIDASGAGTVSGVMVLGDSTAMQVNGAVTIDNDIFGAGNGSSPGSDVNLQTDDPVVITNSQFYAPTSGPTSGISVDSPAASVVIAHNTIGQIDPGDGVLAAGVNVLDGGVELRRNEIFGTDVAVRVTDSPLAVTLSNDLIYGNTLGIESTDSSADSPPSTQGDVSATNETIFDNAVDASVSYTTLTLDSSILGTPIDVVGNNGACDISFSRGSSAASSNGCGNFDTNADPQFVDSASGNFHLQSTSPLIDVGDPASPGPGAVDFYGGPRELQGKACSSVRRDIGAAEYDPGTTPVCPPPPQPTPSPTPTPETTPAAKIDKRPEKRSEDTSPTFKFSSDVAGATFLCKLDKKSFKRCVSPKTYHGLEVGKHSFKVYALSPTGQRGKTRAFKFMVVKPS